MEKYRKAAVAILMALIALANLIWPGLATGLGNETVINATVAALTPILVWLIPNRNA